MIDTLCARGTFDAVSDLAQFLPVTIVAELVGLPPVVVSAQMLKWASAAFNLFGTENARTVQAFEDLKTLRDFLLDYRRPERFEAKVNTDGAPFDVTAARSGITVTVNPGEAISDKLIAAGLDVQMSCQSGVCGTCVTAVL